MADSLALRAAQQADLAVIARWVTNAQETDLWSGGPVSFPLDLEQCRLAIGWDAAANWTLLDRGRVAGFGQILEKPEDRKHVARIIIDPGARGRGLGRALVTGLIDKALSAGVRCVSLNVHPGNDRAIGLYLSLGFMRAESPDPNRTGRFIYMERPA